MIDMEKNNYFKYISSRLISDGGDILHDIAIMILLTKYTNSVTISAQLVTINAIVKVASAFFVRTRIDKLNVKNTLVILDTVYGLVMLIFFILINKEINFIYLYALEVITTLIFSIYKIIREKLLKNITSSENRMRRISLVYTLETIVSVLLPLTVSLFIDILDLRFFIIINSMTFFVSAIIMSSIKLEGDKDSIGKYEVEFDLSIFKKYKDLFIILLIAASVSSISTSSKLIILEYLQKNRTIFNVANLQSIISVGGIAGALFSRKFNEKSINKGFLLNIGILFLVHIISFLHLNDITFFLMILIYGGTFTLLNILVQMYYQHMIDMDLMGYVRSYHTIIVGLTIPVAMYINNNILKLFDLRILFLFNSLILGILIFLIILTGKREDII